MVVDVVWKLLAASSAAHYCIYCNVNSSRRLLQLVILLMRSWPLMLLLLLLSVATDVGVVSVTDVSV